MDKKSKRYAAALLAVFIFFFCANTLFSHTHVTECGAFVVHSHPFVPNSSHTHSGNALLLISQFNAAMFQMDVPAMVAAPAAPLIVVGLVLATCRVAHQSFSRHVAGRGPPSMLLSAI